MTPEQQRTRTKQARLARENTHKNCAVEVKQTGPHWGLYCVNQKCKKKGSWIDWIKKDKLRGLIKK